MEARLTADQKDTLQLARVRGRYTLEELREIDDYGRSLGVEVVPCIQTLAHLRQHLKWSEANPVRDTQEVMLIDEPETYELVDCMLKTCRKAELMRKLPEAYRTGDRAYLTEAAETGTAPMYNGSFY